MNMSSSSKLYGESDSSKLVELPVFVTPAELIFATNKRRSLLTIFNPYHNEAQFRIMTTSPDRFDVSITKGTIKPNRRIDITILLLNQQIDELPEPTDELQIIDHFRITLQIGNLKGNKPIKVHWCNSSEILDTDDLVSSHDKASKIKIRSVKSSTTSSSIQPNATSTSASHNRSFSNQRSPTPRLGRLANQVDHANGGSNVNLVCTICAIACVITLFLPLSIDSELCKKVKPIQDLKQSAGLLSQLGALLSVSYEMKLGCSFALGLFTYRLISTLPD